MNKLIFILASCLVVILVICGIHKSRSEATAADCDSVEVVSDTMEVVTDTMEVGFTFPNEFALISMEFNTANNVIAKNIIVELARKGFPLDDARLF